MNKKNKKEKVPVLFIIFNRPELAQKTFLAIREYKPEKLYVAADGPRFYKEGEAELCEKTRSLILSMVDWKCELETLFSRENAGCGRSVSRAITWMLDIEEYGIILEDDCVPSPDFFNFCEELLPMYKGNEKIAQINGFNPECFGKESKSYCFTAYPSIWGWATWKRSWINMDLYMSGWPLVRKQVFRRFSLFEAIIHVYFWEKMHRSILAGKTPNAWGYQWSLHVFMNNKICVNPLSNMVINTGFIEDSVHCNNTDHPYKYATWGKVSFPLVHPEEVILNAKAERRKSRLYIKNYLGVARSKMKRTLKNIF